MIEIITEHPLDTLEYLIKDQLNALRQDNLKKLEYLVDQTKPILEQISKTDILSRPENKQKTEKLRDLTRNLELAMMGKKENFKQQLDRVSEGKKLLSKYSNAI